MFIYNKLLKFVPFAKIASSAGQPTLRSGYCLAKRYVLAGIEL